MMSAAEPPSATLVIVPTYNEAENIGRICERTLAAAPHAQILVVDDGSPDGTGDLVQGMADVDNRIALLRRPGKAGLGAAYIAGFRYALEHGYRRVIEMDADGSHPPERIPTMIGVGDASAGVGCVIGSRWVTGGSVVNWPLSREIISRAGSMYARVMLSVPVKDVTAGFRMYPIDVLRSLDLDAIDSHGYCFQIDMTRRIHAAGYQLLEVPIEFRERELGESKMSRSIVIEAIGRVTAWGVEMRVRRIRRWIAARSHRRGGVER
jgi:dolichol-phosphate mannosyltransferase